VDCCICIDVVNICNSIGDYLRVRVSCLYFRFCGFGRSFMVVSLWA